MALDISDFSTRELLSALRRAHWLRYDFLTGEPVAEKVWIGQRYIPGGELMGFFATRADIESELRTRPHLPSKKEGKTLRRLMSKTGMTADKLRAHPRFGQDIVDSQQSVPRKVVTAKYARSILTWMPKELFAIRYKIKG